MHHECGSSMLITEGPGTLMFNNTIYKCRRSWTLSSDGQWKEISFSFNRRYGHSRWSTEHYVRVGKEVWILLRRSPTLQQHHYNTTFGTFYDVPAKLLRLHSCTRGAGLFRYGADAFDPIFSYFWNPTDDLPSEDDPDLCVVHQSTTSSVLPIATPIDDC